MYTATTDDIGVPWAEFRVLWLYLSSGYCNISFNTFDIGFYNMIHSVPSISSNFVNIKNRKRDHRNETFNEKSTMPVP